MDVRDRGKECPRQSLEGEMEVRLGLDWREMGDWAWI